MNLLAQHNNLTNVQSAFNNNLVMLPFIFLQFSCLPYWHAFSSIEELERWISEYRAERDARLELAVKRITEPPRSLQAPRKSR
jgi:hypothetical protein